MLSEVIKNLKYARDNIIDDDNIKNLLDRVIDYMEEDLENKEKLIDKQLNELLEDFSEELKIVTKTDIEKAPILSNLYDDYVKLYINDPTEKYTKIYEMRKQLQNKLERILKVDGITLLRAIYYCNTELQEYSAQQAFIYGYSMANQMKNEAITKYPRKNKKRADSPNSKSTQLL